ncbi:hypothetical protein [Actinomadura sp. SCN-SB]|uniref:hypothetical protein n=1 Tax=Actinomadura sp. SCN-SB TaxID=3373092 RepID=UPI00375134D0
MVVALILATVLAAAVLLNTADIGGGNMQGGGMDHMRGQNQNQNQNGNQQQHQRMNHGGGGPH